MFGIDLGMWKVCQIFGQFPTSENYSRWLEILPLHTTTAAIVIKKFMQLFTTYGIPDSIVSDNRPQFQRSEFREFTLEFDFDHRTSSPCFPHASGKAESAVKVAKKLLSQQSLEIALLNYRATPHSSTGVSPAIALMGRQLKTKLPRLPANLFLQPASNAYTKQTRRPKTSTSSAMTGGMEPHLFHSRKSGVNQDWCRKHLKQARYDRHIRCR